MRSKQYHVLIKGNSIGPISVEDVFMHLKRGELAPNDYAWHPGLENWCRVNTFKEFAKDNVEAYKPGFVYNFKRLFSNRKNQRSRYNGTCLVHDHTHVHSAQSIDISEGGACLAISEATDLEVGQALYVHFRPHQGVPAFAAMCEIVYEKPGDPQKNQEGLCYFGVKFKNIKALDKRVVAAQAA